MRNSMAAGCGLALVMVLAIGCSESDSEGSGPDSPDSADAQSAAPDTPSAGSDTRPNAAREYERIHTTLAGEDFLDPLSNLAVDTPPGPAESAFLQSKQDIIQQIITASKIERCEFTLDFSQGVDMLVPHLAWLRSFCKLLQYDAHRFILAPSGEKGAVDRLLAILRISDHLGNDPIILSKLVGVSCANLAMDSISRWEARITDPGNRAMLREELQRVRSGGAYDMKAAFRQEVNSTRTTIQSGRPFTIINGQSEAIPEAEREPLMRQVEQIYAELEAAWDAPDARQRIAAIFARNKNTKAMLFVGSLDKLYETLTKSRAKMDAAIHMLQ